MAVSQAAIKVTLRCTDKLDEYDTRVLTLQPGDRVHIGRASRNSTKPELMIGPANAYIDSPVISREHALLTASTSPPSPCVYITDNGSMHGTMVNGARLEPQRPHRLNNGDVLHFGQNVTREHHFYTAREFQFECSLPTSSFPQGFTVPSDIETSDEEEEELEMDEDMSYPPFYGTEKNPVAIDDAEETISKELVPDEVRAKREDTEDPPSSPVHDTPVSARDQLSAALPAPARYAFIHDQSLDPEDQCEGDDIRSVYSSEDEEASRVDGSASIVNSDESQSDGDMDPDEQVSDYDDEEEDADADADEDFDTTPVDDEDNFSNQVSQTKVLASPVPVRPSSPPTVTLTTPPRQEETPMLFTSSAPSAPKADQPKLSEPEVRLDGFYHSSRTFDDSVEPFRLGNTDSDIPPRPAAPGPMQCWGALAYNSPFSPPTNVYQMVPVPVAEYSSDMMSRCSAPIPPVLKEFTSPYPVQQPQSTPDNPWRSHNSPIPDDIWDSHNSPTVATVSGVRTPPPAPSCEVSSPPPPARRVHISIPEIVENTTQQPPTPTSVTGSLKRKAEVLEEAVEEPDTAPVPLPPSNDATQDGPSAKEAGSSDTAADQRPKKRMRSRLGNVMKTAAAWMVPGVAGAVASVAFLTSVPNDFYVA